MKKRGSTIYDLAELAEVSASTVSAVLNGNWRQRRIAEATAQKVQRLAAQYKYNVNRQASGLRKRRSGLIGMILPMHDNRYFGRMSQVFERLARERHWYPMVVSTLRDPALELETVDTLISYRIEYLVVAGATDPDSVSRVCSSHGIAHVNIDLPGTQGDVGHQRQLLGRATAHPGADRSFRPGACSACATRPTSSAASLPTMRRDGGSTDSPMPSGPASAKSMPTRSTPAATKATSPRRRCARLCTSGSAACRARSSSTRRSRWRASCAS